MWKVYCVKILRVRAEDLHRVVMSNVEQLALFFFDCLRSDFRPNGKKARVEAKTASKDYVSVFRRSIFRRQSNVLTQTIGSLHPDFKSV